MVYKQTLIPDRKNHSIEMPEKFFGKKVEVTVTEVNDTSDIKDHMLPVGKRVDINELFENFGHAPDFPTAEVIRQQTWQSKW